MKLSSEGQSRADNHCLCFANRTRGTVIIYQGKESIFCRGGHDVVAHIYGDTKIRLIAYL